VSPFGRGKLWARKKTSVVKNTRKKTSVVKNAQELINVVRIKRVDLPGFKIH